MGINLLSIIIPCFNEETTIHKILDEINKVELSYGIKKEVILVNDASTDNTDFIIKKHLESTIDDNIIYIIHEKNRGKGAAIHTGIKEAKGDYLIVQDADLEYNPHEYNDLLVPVFKDNADIVYGSRFMGSKPHRVLFFWHTIGNKFLTGISNMLTNLNLTDMETCYKLFRTSIIKDLVLLETRFGFEPEITAKTSRIKNVKIYEVGISYYGRTYQEGKKIGWKDGFRAIYCILKYNIWAK